jgi:hypothetical protein
LKLKHYIMLLKIYFINIMYLILYNLLPDPPTFEKVKGGQYGST